MQQVIIALMTWILDTFDLESYVDAPGKPEWD
jgi:hypothetical protein